MGNNNSLFSNNPMNTDDVEFTFPTLSSIYKYPDFDTHGDRVSRYFNAIHKYGALSCDTFRGSEEGIVVRLGCCDFSDFISDYDIETNIPYVINPTTKDIYTKDGKI